MRSLLVAADGLGELAASVQNKLISRPIEWASNAIEQVHLQTMPVENWRGNKTEESQKIQQNLQFLRLLWTNGG